MRAPILAFIVLALTPPAPAHDGAGGWATGINAAGTIAGWVETPQPPQIQAYVWSDGAGEGLGTVGGYFSFGYAISDSGVVVGQDQGLDGTMQAFRAEGGVMTPLGVLGGEWSTANDINDVGTIVGAWGFLDGVSSWAFRWDPATGMRDLGSLPGCSAQPRALNRSGEIVGGARCPRDVWRALLWRDGRIIDLNDAIDTSGADLGDVDHDGAVGVDDLIGLLAGWGTDGSADLNHDGVTDRADLALLPRATRATAASSPTPPCRRSRSRRRGRRRRPPWASSGRRGGAP